MYSVVVAATEIDEATGVGDIVLVEVAAVVELIVFEYSVEVAVTEVVTATGVEGIVLVVVVAVVVVVVVGVSVVGSSKTKYAKFY